MVWVDAAIRGCVPVEAGAIYAVTVVFITPLLIILQAQQTIELVEKRAVYHISH
jgi:hypothetical protein